jgi:hypothetical protein
LDYGPTSRFSAASARYVPAEAAASDPPRPGHLVDDRGHAEVFQQTPGGADRAELLVLDTIGQPAAANASEV